MSNKSGLFEKLGMTREKFERLADQHKPMMCREPKFVTSDGYVMSEVELEVFCSLFKAADKPQQVLLASMLRFIQREISKEAA